ncbi:MAG TPA: serine/threonine-protein kinase [bacterium]|nr:serine/threonine-protein kinase [bacterium]HPO52511.1 serine/threonine-protein kinase [bacterium]
MARNFSEYYLAEKIGVGAFATVYKAYSQLQQPTYGKVVAIKVLNEKIYGASESKVIRQFEREANIAMQLNHENVVKVYNWGKFNGRYAMIMEYVDGKNLNEFIHEPGKYNFSALVEIGYKIACGLIHVHSHGIVHKDIKPENVLISNDLKTVKITDFGIAKVPRRWWQRDLFDRAGSERRFSHISYAAPEQKSGHSDARSDIFSLGVLIDELITVKLTIPEIPGKNDQDYFRRISEVVFKYRKTQKLLSEYLLIPDQFKEILKRATHDDPAMRYQTAEEFAFALSRFIEHTDSSHINEN